MRLPSTVARLQKFYAAHHEKINLVSIAVDAQGTDVVKPWCEKAKSEFTTLVDRKNTLGQMLNLRAVPYGILVEEAGRIVKEPFNIDVKDTETIDLLNKWRLPMAGLGKKELL